MTTCPACRTPVAGDAAFCPACGHAFSSIPIVGGLQRVYYSLKNGLKTGRPVVWAVALGVIVCLVLAIALLS
jgi:threonine/homoserine/homoserine lactone efflux protein